MKFLKILGIAVAVHVTTFLILIAIPGCHSTVRQSSSTPPADLPPSVSYPNGGNSSPAATPPAERSPSINNAALNPPLVSSSDTVSFPSPANGNNTVHFNPTRPGSPVVPGNAAQPVKDAPAPITYTVANGDVPAKIAKKHGITTAELLAANNLKPNSPIHPGQKLIVPVKAAPASAPAGTTASSSNAGANDTLTYEVKPGETLAVIAKRSGTSVATIKSLNKLKSDIVRAGQKLQLPAGPNSAAALAATPDNVEPQASAKAPVDGVKYTVRSGETLGQVAKKFGVSLRDIATDNNISDPKKVREGQELVIRKPKNPAAGKTPAPAPASTQPAAAPVPADQPAPSPVAPAPEPSLVTPSPATEPPPPVIRVDEGSGSAPKTLI